MKNRDLLSFELSARAEAYLRRRWQALSPKTKKVLGLDSPTEREALDSFFEKAFLHDECVRLARRVELLEFFLKRRKFKKVNRPKIPLKWGKPGQPKSDLILDAIEGGDKDAD